jgi:3-hydroxyisobutyrate dehydrogenase-like beta-hydroxyacid dehydrogenase
MAAKRIGFLGATGLMGHGMAKNLAVKGFPVTLCVRGDRTDRIADILQAGAKRVAHPADVARSSDVIVMCLTGSAAVEEVVFGSNGISSAAKPGLIVVDTSTSEVESSNNTRARLAQQGVEFVDAPLTRTPQAAEAGTANTMVGASPAVFAELTPVFRAYCEHIIHAGPPGHGLVLKLINNFVGQAITTATAEGLATAAKV